MFIQKTTRKFFLAISLMTCTFNVTLPSQAQAVSATTNQTQAIPPTVTLFAAGSLTGSLTEIANDFTQQYGVTVNTNFGPSGLLEQSLKNGAKADVFASADTGNPLKLYQQGKSGPVATFTSNRLVAVARSGLSVTPDNLLDELLNPQIKVGTSTPLSDPLGDYTEQVFQKADVLRPGSFQTLDAKALRLVGGADSPPVPSGKNNVAYFLEDTKQADIFLAYYTSGLSALQAAPDLQLVPLPDTLAVSAPYGLTVLKGASPYGQELADYILSPAGQQVLAKNGFSSPSTSVPEPQPLAGTVFAVSMALLLKKKVAFAKKQ